MPPTAQRLWLILLLVGLSCSSDVLNEPEPPGVPRIGPVAGTLFAIGGTDDIALFDQFAALAGGMNAPIVFIPTARADDELPFDDLVGLGRTFRETLGWTNITVLHTRDPAVADTPEFVAPLQTAAAVFFSGGRQWRLADAYLGTRTHTELWNLLARGGVIGGTSAGASILASFLVRGDTQTNTIIEGDHTEGLAFLRDAGIDQHVAQRGRTFDLIPLIETHPELLGLGIDENTALLIRGDTLEVVGRGEVHVTDQNTWTPTSTDQDRVFQLRPGTRYDLNRRVVMGAN